MKTIEINGVLRKELGKKSTKQIRKEGNVPCVIYGNENNIHFYAPENIFKNLIYTHEAHLIKLKVDNQEYKAVLHDKQFHPVTDSLLHADFLQIYDNKPITIDIPVTAVGESEGVKEGGELMIKRRHLKVRGMEEHLPEELLIDVTDLKIHNSIKIGDLSFDNIELLDPKIATVITVTTSRVALKAAEEEAAAAAAAAEVAAEAEAAEAAEGEEEAAAEAPVEEKEKDQDKEKEKEKQS